MIQWLLRTLHWVYISDLAAKPSRTGGPVKPPGLPPELWEA